MVTGTTTTQADSVVVGTTTTTGTAPQAAPQEDKARTYTQAEIDQMIEDRLHRERKKFADYEEIKAKAEKFDAAEEANKSELQKVTEKAEALQKQVDSMTKAEEVRNIRAEVSKETGIPATLLTADTKEACEEQAKAIAEFTANNESPAYPSVKDGGDPQKVASKKSTRDQFAEWLEQV